MKMILKVLFMAGRWLATVIVMCSPLETRSESRDLKKVTDWDSFKSAYNKSYENVEVEFHSMRTFLHNAQLIKTHNEKFKRGYFKYYLKMNNFGDMEYHEFTQKLAKLSRSQLEWNHPTGWFKKVDQAEAMSVDWREKGAVSRVKSQGLCGAGWAFGTTGSLEGQHFLKTGRLVSLSEQNLLDCTAGYGNAGCSGGFAVNGFQYVIDNEGIADEESYPYAGTVARCKFKKARVGSTAKGYVQIPQEDEDLLKNAVAFVGPISACMNAQSHRFQFYGGGIFVDKDCSPKQINHGVLIVGYGVQNETEYWLLKNSMGTNWGEGGYMKLARNRNNHCGISSSTCYPVV